MTVDFIDFGDSLKQMRKYEAAVISSQKTINQNTLEAETTRSIESIKRLRKNAITPTFPLFSYSLEY
jgi:hypothetical protein